MKVFVDDFSVAREKAKHVFYLRLCLQRCRDTSLKLNPAKCAFAVKTGVLLGHIVSKNGLEIDPKKVEAIVKLLPSENLKQLERFVGKVKWHTRFIKYLAHVACPLYRLTKKDVVFEWSSECQQAFEMLKKMLSIALVMISVNQDKIFYVNTNAPGIALESALMQEQA